MVNIASYRNSLNVATNSSIHVKIFLLFWSQGKLHESTTSAIKFTISFRCVNYSILNVVYIMLILLLLLKRFFPHKIENVSYS